MLPVMSLEALVPEHRLRNNIHLQSSASTNFSLCRIFSSQSDRRLLIILVADLPHHRTYRPVYGGSHSLHLYRVANIQEKCVTRFA